LTGLLGNSAIDRDPPGQNQRSCALARAGQCSFHQKGIKSDTGHRSYQPSAFSLQLKANFSA
jgi:hypothetical protein